MGALVDYSSDEEDHDAEGGADVTLGGAPGAAAAAAAASRPLALPPLPRAFHDLYAANVRTSPADDPSLHHGRTRATPHVAGQWPSHIYIEWFPSPAEHDGLAAFVTALRDALAVTPASASASADNSPLYSLLTSDLGAPLPLHVSLSRPFVLATAAKAGFLAGLVAAVAGGAPRVAPFALVLGGVDWYRSPDAARAFLVVRVQAVAEEEVEEEAATTAAAADSHNRPLVTLLARCNEQVAAAGQPTLYASSSGQPLPADAASAFHISLAWTLADDVASWTDTTQRVFAAWQAASPAHRGLHVRVDSVKAKIGNVVTDIPLDRRRRTGHGVGANSLFGL